MNKRTIQKTVYVAEDGREFEIEEQALKQDEKISILNDLKKEIPLDNIIPHHAIYVSGGDSFKRLLEIFNINASSHAHDYGWNLLIDNGTSANCISIKVDTCSDCLICLISPYNCIPLQTWMQKTGFPQGPVDRILEGCKLPNKEDS